MKKQNPEIVAHRGLTGLLTQEKDNTLSAIRRALESSEVDAVELDIKMTKDGHLVVFHDPILDLKTNGRGKVKNYTLAELRKFKIKGTDEGIPTLKEVFQLFAGSRSKLLLDFHHPKILKRLIPLIEEYNLQKQVEYTSINHRMLKQLKFQLPHSQIVPAFFGPRANHIIRKSKKLQANTVHVFFPNLFLNPRMVSKLQKAEIQVRAFTVNRPHTAHRLMQQGVSIISSRSIGIQLPKSAKRKQSFVGRILRKKNVTKFDCQPFQPFLQR